MPTLPTGRALLDPNAILAQAGLAVDMNYADFGSGTLGHFVFPAAALVGPKGHAYAVDILKGALAGIESRARLEGVTNLTTVWGDIERVRGVGVPDGSLHLVSIINITRLIVKSPAVLDEVQRVLRPDGKLLLVDWKPGGGSFGPPPERRIAPDAIRPLLDKAGFVQVKEFAAGPHHWGLVFRRAAV